LAKTLESVARLVVPSSMQWHVLVVDNNSQDQTREVVEGFCRRYPERFSYLFEPRQGKSYALNTGIRHASGDVIAFIDDDVEADPHWLHKLTAPFTYEEWDGAGGRILPEAGFVPQPWMDVHSPRGLAPLAMFDLGTEAGELKEAPFGTNMAFRKNIFAMYGGFRTDLGPQPGSEIRDEDTEFGRRLLAAGKRFWYEPSAVVYHAVSTKRVSKKYFQTWWFDKGRADIRGSVEPTDSRWQVAGVPLYLFRRLVIWALRSMSSTNPQKKSECNLKMWWLAGLIAECYRQAHRE
jgi:glucosyl-dolichyl phosphate glucuronosyltransferase